MYIQKLRTINERFRMVGIKDGIPVFRKYSGELFTLKTNGDLDFIRPEAFENYNETAKLSRRAGTVSYSPMAGKSHGWKCKLASQNYIDVEIVGQDLAGNVLMKNSRGEEFIIDPVTGDMIFNVK